MYTVHIGHFRQSKGHLPRHQVTPSRFSKTTFTIPHIPLLVPYFTGFTPPSLTNTVSLTDHSILHWCIYYVPLAILLSVSFVYNPGDSLSFFFLHVHICLLHYYSLFLTLMSIPILKARVLSNFSLNAIFRKPYQFLESYPYPIAFILHPIQ